MLIKNKIPALITGEFIPDLFRNTTEKTINIGANTALTNADNIL